MQICSSASLPVCYDNASVSWLQPSTTSSPYSARNRRDAGHLPLTRYILFRLLQTDKSENAVVCLSFLKREILILTAIPSHTKRVVLALAYSSLAKQFVLFVLLIWRSEYAASDSIALPTAVLKYLTPFMSLDQKLDRVWVVRRMLSTASAVVGISGKFDIHNNCGALA